jgi:hypothetical protein
MWSICEHRKQEVTVENVLVLMVPNTRLSACKVHETESSKCLGEYSVYEDSS